MDETAKRMKSCDQCKARKVRCTGAGHRGATSCTNCARRNETCHFGPLRRPQRQKQRDHVATTRTTASPSTNNDTLGPLEVDNNLMIDEMMQYNGLQELYIDQLLAGPHPGSARHMPNESLQTLGVFGSGYSLTFFSEARLASLEQKLGHDRISGIRAQMTAIIAQRMRTVEKVPTPPVDSDRCRVFGVGETFIANCIHAYFEHVHPIHPFLDQSQVKSIALGGELEQKLSTDKAWVALFYSILALGSQYHDGGSFQPTNNVAWKFFSTALAIFPDLLITKANLTILQAITAMAIFASNVSCMQLEYAMISEGVKKAQMLGYNRSPAPGHDARNRTFWVLYCLEKTMTFTLARSSSIMDSDISSALPTQEAHNTQHEYGTFDSFHAFIRLSRIFSRIYASLHTASVRYRPPEYFKATINRLKAELEQWCDTIPPPFQPKLTIRTHTIGTAQTMSICIRLHYGYHSAMLHLNRAALQVRHSDINVSDTIADIMSTARSILQLTAHIDTQPYTPIWILAAVPLAALFVLFDLIIDDPTHPDTASNLAVLDIGSGHFSRIEYASQGTLPGSILSDFAHIARSYVREKIRPQREVSAIGPISSNPAPTLGTDRIPSNAAQLLQVHDASTQIAMQMSPNVHPFSHNWSLKNGETIAGTDILDLFGSYLPSWDDDWIFGTTTTEP